MSSGYKYGPIDCLEDLKGNTFENFMKDWNNDTIHNCQDDLHPPHTTGGLHHKRELHLLQTALYNVLISETAEKDVSADTFALIETLYDKISGEA